MKIREFCMFYNEHTVLEIKIAEARKWIDELHLCEANRTFQNKERVPVLPAGDDFVKTHVYDGATHFLPAFRWGPSRHWPFFRKKLVARRNETLQRNMVHDVFADAADDDIIILSDIDEIIDPRFADEVIDAARKHGGVSVELHHTFFYLNLYSTNWHELWPNAPENYAYRVFVMTGKFFHQLRRGEGADHLRRRGEWGKLTGKFPLLKGIRGFHHSWLGDEEAAFEKITSYCHSVTDHRADLTDEEGQISKVKLGAFIRSGQSIFPGNKVEIRSFEAVPPLQTVVDNLDRYQHLIL